jgi:Fe/S biogenesis protein NfuA
MTMKQRVEEALERIRPRLSMHGGGVEVVNVLEDEGIVELELTGGCAGCAMATLTLKAGIEALLLEEVEGVTEVIDITDHAKGESPYYT